MVTGAGGAGHSVTGAGQSQMDEAPTGELPSVELGTSGAGVVPAGGAACSDVWSTGELPRVLEMGTAGALPGTSTGALLGTSAGVVGTGAGLLLGTTGMTLVVTYGEVVAGQDLTDGPQLVMVTSTVW